ncbi:hypothetical protein PIB30_018349 [Stylosanthes scabra]|uniref:Uncharacterized protein n=1 Tax=Stylosanthes scabra TaxID=79078 RepID=A0ABU6Q7R9_9FABA|nr:hypothetical protein [Stylosanthes scabra]
MPLTQQKHSLLSSKESNTKDRSLIQVREYYSTDALLELIVEEHENTLLWMDIDTLKNLVNGLAKDKKDLESRVMELCAEKEEIEVDRKYHSKFDKMDPTEVVFDWILVDAVEGDDDHTTA